MATGTKEKTQVVAYDEYVDTQLTRVRSYIKLADVIRLLMGLAALVVTYLVAVVILDHWIVELSQWARLGCLLTLVVGVILYLIWYVLPEAMRRINPAYAAQVIERGEPSLKNSLINFVMLRPRQDSIHKVVYREVEQQAAQRLSQVEVDSTIDQTPLIRIACALLASLVFFAGYTVLSPKSPFQTLSRIARPFGNIARPARVRIRDVQPGDATVYAGRKLTVSAYVEDIRDDEPVWLMYSSTDGQLGDQRVVMSADKSGLKYEGTLPKQGGIQRELEYRIVAGDAVAGPFVASVSPSPSFFIEEIHYEYPPYTGKEPESFSEKGEISALEGTRVTIVARANLDIQHARIEFDPDTDAAAEKPYSSRLTMRHEGKRAEVTFPLVLEEDRKTPKHKSYQLRFTSVDNNANDQPIEYPITVTPDLKPLVEILIPENRQVGVPVNAKQLVQVRAVDPDYGLSAIRLEGVLASDRSRVIDEQLLKEPGTGQRVVRFQFRPSKLGLNPGDVVYYRAKAIDNRTDPLTRKPAANNDKTENYAFQITEAMTGDGDGESEGQRGLSQDDGEDGEGSGNEDGDSEGDGEGENGEGSESGEGDGESESQDGEGPEGLGGEGENGSSDSSDSEGSEGEEGASGESSSDGEESGTDGQSGESGDDSGDEGMNDGEGGQPGEPSDQADASDGGETGKGQSGDESGEPSDSDGTGETGESKVGEQGDSNSESSESQNGENGEGSNAGESEGSEDDSPVSSDGTEDDEAFERILDHLKEQNGENPDGTPKSDESGDSESSEGSESEGSESEGSESEGSESEGSESEGSESEGSESEGSESEGSESEGSESEGSESEGSESEGSDSEGSDSEGSDSEGSDSEGSDSEGSDSEGSDSEGSESEGSESEGSDSEGSDSEGSESEGSESEGSEMEGDAGSDGESGDGKSGDNPSGGEDGSEGSSAESGDSAGSENGETGDAGSSDANSAGDKPDSGDPSQQQQGGDGIAGSELGKGSTTGESRRGGAEAGPAEDRERGSDAANLEYARKATDMVLDYLKDGKKNPNRRKLLDRLGWTPDQMQKFKSRWERLHRDAGRKGKAGEQGARELQEALKSLGLRPGRDRIRRGNSRDDKNNSVRDQGTRSLPPAEYIDQYRAYLEGKSLRGDR